VFPFHAPGASAGGMPSASPPLRLGSWNVNGVRSAAKNGALAPWLAGPWDVVALQEVRATRAQLEACVGEGSGWHVASAEAERPGYSGVALLARRAPDEVATSLGREIFDAEGRYVRMRFGRLHVVSAYMPNGSGVDRDNGRVPYKLAFYKRVAKELEALSAAGDAVVVLTDANTAPHPIDLARPKENEGTSGFLPEERAELHRWFRRGWVDAFRAKHADPAAYTWWAQRGGCRARNVGWRIDLALVHGASPDAILDCWHEPHVLGSDHCPIGVALARAVLDAPKVGGSAAGGGAAAPVAASGARRRTSSLRHR
jgi:exodeoxyribonuclease-3